MNLAFSAQFHMDQRFQIGSIIEKRGSSISFSVPSLPNNPPIRGLKVCFVTEPQYWWIYPRTKLSNKTKDLNWINGSQPLPSRFPDYGCDFMMLSHWKLGNLLEAGDEVTVSCEDLKIQVKECGIKLVYNEDEEEEQNEQETKEMTQQHDTTFLSWTEQTLTELSQLHDSGTSYYFGNKYSQGFPEIDINRGTCLRCMIIFTPMKHFTRNLY